MTRTFHKMHGLGNDFVIFDARQEPLVMDEPLARAISDRRTGIGCDQLIVLEPSSVADLKMRIWNHDGIEVESCGNASRCVVALTHAKTIETGAIRELQLPVVVVRDLEESDVVMTLRSAYRQKPPALREAEELAKPIYVLKSNTILQMQACLTSLYSVEVDPREAALRETEEAIGMVMRAAKPVELSPQNAYIRRLQHQMAERANLVSRSRGREPYRRVRLYPDQVRVWR